MERSTSVPQLSQQIDKLFQVGSLSESGVKMKDAARVKEKISSLVQGGTSTLQIITDFDSTLTQEALPGENPTNSVYVFAVSPGLKKEFLKGLRELYGLLMKTDNDPNISDKDKVTRVGELWLRSGPLFLGLPYDLNAMKQAVSTSKVQIRKGLDWSMSKLKEEKIPVLVLSGGLGDVIECIMRHYNIMHTNVHIISNFFTHENGLITGIKGDMIHAYNKTEHALENAPYFQEFKDRRNVILMGDCVGDADMNQGVPPGGTVLKIGFLNENVKEKIDKYMNHFDIVLIDDRTVNVFNDVLKLIINSN